ncbi:MAG: bifunctional folylpolyglutamate synthase/dihydrofolate synthase, partial [Candidatus Binatia bacterium]
MTEYERTLEWLFALEAAKGMDFKLERVALALERLGHPQRRFASLHVAGTNGKGSVAAMLHAMLAAGGYRVGLYTSPHLVELGERIRVDDRDIGRGEVVGLSDEIRAAVTGRGIDLTFFEFLTVLAFLYFARSGVEVAVVEVGLGGRLDATNVLDPLAAVITTIGLDHTEWLGDSIAAIAAEKGGIIKSGRPVVVGRIEGDALDVLQGLAAERGAPLLRAGRDYRVAGGPAGLDFDGLGWSLRGVPVGLRGAHQRDNAGTAVAALSAVSSSLPVAEAAIRRGLASVRWKGRMDVVATAPLTVLDGAHNLDGVDALLRELPELLGGRPLHLLFAVMGDKAWRPMVERLAPKVASAVVTQVLPPRGAPADAVAEAFRAHCPATVVPEVGAAFAEVQRRAGAGDAIVACGSLFLVGALYAIGVGAAAGRAGT